MKGKLVNRRQPFGDVSAHKPSGGEGAPPAMHSKALGGITMRPNNGLDHGPSFGHKNPNAEREAHMHQFNPFAWTGMPMADVGAGRDEDQYSVEGVKK